MRITPLDVRKQEFRRVVRGLDADEVHAFLATVADEYEAALTDNKNLRERVMELDEKVAEYRNMERTLRDTLITAERVMSEARQNARKEAELILRDAQLKANRETAGIATKVDALKAQLRELRGHRDSFLARLQSLSEAQLGLVDSYRSDFDNEDARVESLMEREESVEEPGQELSEKAFDPADTRPYESTADTAIPSDEEMADTPSVPVPPVASAPAFASPSNDQWRGYSVGSESEPAASAPAPSSPSESGSPYESSSGTAYEPPRVEPVATYDEQPTQRIDPVEIQVPEDVYAGEVAAAQQVEDEAIDEVSEALNVLNETRSEWPSDDSGTPSAGAPSGQSDAPVATYPGAETQETAPSQPADAAADPYANPNPDPQSQNPEGQPQDGSSSRWSLSKFTKGLASF